MIDYKVICEIGQKTNGNFEAVAKFIVYFGLMVLMCFEFCACSTSGQRSKNPQQQHPNNSSLSTQGKLSIDFDSEAKLNNLVARLNHPQSRMQAFSELLAFALPDGYYVRTGDWAIDDLHDRAFEAVRTCPERETVVGILIGRLQKDNTSSQALSDLIRFAGLTYLYNRGGSGVYGGSDDKEFDALREKAADALNDCVELKTIGLALDSAERHVQYWAVRHFGGIELSEETQRPWLPLLHKLEMLAVAADSNIREVATRKLSEFPQSRRFLEKRIEVETSPEILMRLMYQPQHRDEFNKAFVARMNGLLDHQDEQVRHDALLFIGSNSSCAPMWQFNFNQEILHRVIELTQSKSAKERSAAAYALNDIRHLGLDESRIAFIDLADDPSSDVRWRVASGLKEQYDRADVRAVITALLEDAEPSVRYMTIMAVGPENHIRELDELTHCDDRRIAENAVRKLEQISRNREAK